MQILGSGGSVDDFDVVIGVGSFAVCRLRLRCPVISLSPISLAIKEHTFAFHAHPALGCTLVRSLRTFRCMYPHCFLRRLVQPWSSRSGVEWKRLFQSKENTGRME